MGISKLYVLASIGCISSAGLAQQAEEQPGPFTYASYHICDITQQGRVDEIIESEFAPIYDTAVESGAITSWGWLGHRTGGTWRRALYYSAPSIEALFAAEQTIDTQLQRSGADSDQEFGRICDVHEDYIWMRLASSTDNLPSSERGAVGLSTYYVCDLNEQNRADELLSTVLAPVYDAHVGDGMYNSWAWQSHFVGGQYRRLATFTAEDYPTLLKTRSLVQEAIADNEAAQFNQICTSHSDYLWDILLETP